MTKKKTKYKYVFVCFTCREEVSTNKIKDGETAMNGELYGKLKCPICKKIYRRKVIEIIKEE